MKYKKISLTLLILGILILISSLFTIKNYNFDMLGISIVLICIAFMIIINKKNK